MLLRGGGFERDFEITFLTFAGNALASELDEARLLLDTAERSRRHAENEVGDVREAMNELTRLVWIEGGRSMSNFCNLFGEKNSLNHFF